MTEQEAMETIKCAIAEVEWNYPMNYAIAFEMAMQALEKQMPKKALLCGKHEIQGTFYICPICSQIVGIDDNKFDYCVYCGQHIDWSEEE